MLIRKTIKDYKSHTQTWQGQSRKSELHINGKTKVTWWFLFMPLISYEYLNTTSI